MKKSHISNALFALAVLLLAACASDNARYVDSGGSRSLISTNKINIADWNTAATALVNDMLASGCLDKYQPKPVRLMVSRIVNRTGQSIDTDMLTKQITITLNNSGKAVAVTDDKASKELAEMQAFMKNSTVPIPQIAMSGKIIEDREKVGDVQEVTYTFMLSINSDGVSVWEGQKQITKQVDKSAFGF